MPQPVERIIRQPRELRALVSAQRQEITDVLAGMGEVSVAELADALGRPADSLYFHLRALQRAGLVVHAGFRSNGRRQEALFRAAAAELRLHYDPRDDSNRSGVASIVSSMLRLGMRDFRRAYRAGNVKVSGEQREIWALRKTARLNAAQVVAVNRSIERLANSFSVSRGSDRLYAITVLFTPLDRRERRKGTHKNASKGTKR